jgi:uncharacterized PurR-regulated membrane protein YhhQ (DUF165 family)
MLIRDYVIIGVLAVTTITALAFNLLASIALLFFAFYALIGALTYSFLVDRSDAKHRRRLASTLPRDEHGRWIT